MSASEIFCLCILGVTTLTISFVYLHLSNVIDENKQLISLLEKQSNTFLAQMKSQKKCQVSEQTHENVVIETNNAVAAIDLEDLKQNLRDKAILRTKQKNGGLSKAKSAEYAKRIKELNTIIKEYLK